MPSGAGKIGPWTLGSQLGHGGQGSVFEGRSAEGTRIAAVKVLNVTRPKKRARFIREVMAHASLTEQKARNIMPIIDHNLEELTEPGDGVRGYIAMPRARWSLDDLASLFQGRTELCLQTFLGIVNGIRYAHAQNVVHRDIKPANILFLDGSLREPMVSDFGICFLKETPEADRLTEAQETVGARFFMAPEQERGRTTDVEFTADIYALGKLLHFMLTSRQLYREELSEAFSQEELREDPRLASIRDELLARMVVKDPAERIQSADVLLAVASEEFDLLRRCPTRWTRMMRWRLRWLKRAN